MRSIASVDVMRKVLSRIEDPEHQLWGNLDQASAGLMKLFLETLALSEVEVRAGAGLYERGPGRTDHRNGYRERAVQTSFATITVRIPRLRGQGYVPSVLERGARAIPEVEGWVLRAFSCGLSRAEVIRLMESVSGCRPSDKLLGKVRSRAGRSGEGVAGACAWEAVAVSVSGCGVGQGHRGGESDPDLCSCREGS